MNFLPIVVREMQVASRRPGTYRVRLWTALATAGCLGVLMLDQQARGNLMPAAGKNYFLMLSALALLYTLAAGLAFTADCLSEEKREGTLGLLYLTDLKGYEVVLGKLASSSLNAFWGLLSIFPMLIIPVSLGGVLGRELWGMVLILMNTLGFSLAAGLLASAIADEQSTAMLITAGLVLGIFCGGWLLVVLGLLLLWRAPRRPEGGISLRLQDWENYYLLSIWTIVLGTGASYLLTGNAVAAAFLPSPGFAWAQLFNGSGTSRTTFFWGSLLATHLWSWLLLAGAVYWANRGWREEASCVFHAHLAGSIPESAPPGRQSSSRRLLDENPISWLASRNSRLKYWVRGWLAGIVVIEALGLIFWHAIPYVPGIHNLLRMLPLSLSHFGLWFLVALQASYCFVRARRSETMEILCTFPQSRTLLLQGQWMVLRQRFWWPIGLVFILGWLFTLMRWSEGFTVWPGNTYAIMGPAILRNFIMFIADFFALGWVAMWLAWSLKKPGNAAWLSLLYVIIIPALLMNFSSPLYGLMHRLGIPGLSWLPALVAFLGKDAAFICCAKRNLRATLAENKLPSALPRHVRMSWLQFPWETRRR